MTDIGPIRSALFVPATRLDRVPKALNSGADAVIVDLEDAVPVAKKSEARENLVAMLPEVADSPVIVRVNSEDTEFFAEDIAQICSCKIAAIMIPNGRILYPEPNGLLQKCMHVFSLTDHLQIEK